VLFQSEFKKKRKEKEKKKNECNEDDDPAYGRGSWKIFVRKWFENEKDRGKD